MLTGWLFPSTPKLHIISKSTADNQRIKDSKLELKIEVNPPKSTPSSTRPIENKLLSDFIELQALPHTHFHQVTKVIHRTASEIKTFYLKKNPSNTAVSELEATSAAFYRVLAPDHIPSTYAVYDNQDNYIGVVSEEIPGFKSTAFDKLQLEDLNTDFIETHKLSTDTLDEIDTELRKLEEENETLNRKMKWLDENEKLIQEKIDNVFQATSTNANQDIVDDKAIENIKEIYINKYALTLAKKKNSTQLTNYYKEIELKYHLTKENIHHYRIVKGLAIGLTTSYIFMEDDLHRNNLSKDGKRIDFDMSLWPISYNFKDSSLIYFRKPHDMSFTILAEDIVNFPNLTCAKPFYWPTNPPQTTSSTTLQGIFRKWVNNAYPLEENSLYQTLKNNSVFKHHKYCTFAKYLLTNSSIYQQIAKKHMRDECKLDSSSLTDTLIKLQNSRIAEFERILLSIPEFGEFFKTHHKKIAADLLHGLNKQNIEYRYHLQSTDEKSAVTPPLKALGQIEKSCRNLIEIIDLNIRKQKITNTDLKITPPPVKAEIPELTGKYEEIKSIILSTMNSYINPGYFGLFGTRRNHVELAKQIINFCEGLHPDANDKAANIAVIHAVINELKTHQEHIAKGGMHTLLDELINKALKVLPKQPVFQISKAMSS